MTKQARKSDSLQATMKQLRKLLAESDNRSLVVIIDQSTIIVDSGATLYQQRVVGNNNTVGIDSVIELTTIDQHGTGNTNTLDVY